MTDLRLLVPPGRHGPERRHAATVVFADVLGLDVELGESDVEVPTVTDGHRRLAVAEAYFSPGLPERPVPPDPSRRRFVDTALASATPVPADLPLLFGDDGPIRLTNDDAGGVLDCDVFGAAFFLVTRVEEIGNKTVDDHGRFRASASTAVRGGFIRRPVVEEHVAVLWAALTTVWPRLERRRQTYKVVPTFDVDNPFAHRYRPFDSVARTVVSQATVRRRPAAAMTLARDWTATRRRGVAADPWNTFGRLMDGAEALGEAGIFHLIADPDPRGRNPDAVYRLDNPDIEALLGQLRERGHRLGVHGSYHSHGDVDQLRTEVDSVRAVADRLGQSGPLQGRQHYLRWDAATSPATHAAAGLDLDSTVGFAERVGFRTGLCRPHQAYDHVARRTLPLMERPLVVMDRTLVHPDYEGLDRDAALDAVIEVADACRRHNGELVLLWHNDSLADPILGPLWDRVVQELRSSS